MSVKNQDNPKLAAASNIPNDNSPSAEDLSQKALTFQERGQFKKSKIFYFKAHLLYKSNHDSLGCIETSLKLGDIHRQLEQFNESLRWYQKAQQYSIKFSTPYIDSLIGIGMARRGLGQYHQAIPIFTRCFQYYTKLRDMEGSAFALWSLGTTQRFAGNIREAEKNLRRSFQLQMKFRDRSALAYTLCGWGGTLRMMGWAHESGELYKKANRIFKKNGDKFGLAYSYCGIGNSLRMQNKFQAGFFFMSLAEKLYRSLHQKGPLAFVLWSRAQSEIYLLKRTQAKYHLKESNQLFKSVKDQRGLVYSDLGWGEYYRIIDPIKSRTHFRLAKKNALSHHLPFEALHADSRLKTIDNHKQYKRLGVHIRRFKSYLTLP